MTVTGAQRTDLPPSVEAELDRITRGYADAFHFEDLTRDLIPFLARHPELVEGLDPGGPRPGDPGYEAHLEAVAREAVGAWERTHVHHGPQDGAVMPAPAWMRGLVALFDQLGEADEAGLPELREAIARAVEEASRATGLGERQVVDLYKRWAMRRMDLTKRVFAYEEAANELLLEVWPRHPKGAEARLGELFAAGLVRREDLLRLAHEQGLTPATETAAGAEDLFPGRWVLAADAENGG